MAKEHVKSEAAYILTNLIRAKLHAKKNNGDIPRENIDNVKTHLKNFKVASRYIHDFFSTLAYSELLGYIRNSLTQAVGLKKWSDSLSS